MSRLLKIAATLALLSSVTACTVVPAQVGYAGPSVSVVAVRPAPYYVAPAPAPYYGPPPYYRGYGYGYGPGYRHGRW